MALPLAQASATGVENWYDAEFGFAQVREQGFDGSGVTIAVAEVGVDLNAPDLAGADIELVPMPEACRPMCELAMRSGGVGIVVVLKRRSSPE